MATKAGEAFSELEPPRRRGRQEFSLIMNICVIAHTAFGSDSRVRREAECLARRGDVVDIFCLRHPHEIHHEIVSGVHVHRIKRYRKPITAPSICIHLILFFLVSFVYVTYYHARRHYDIVHVHSIPDFEVFAALIPKLLGAGIILDIHDIMPEFYMSKFGVSKHRLMVRLIQHVERFSVNFADYVITASPLFRDKLITRSASPDKCATILNLPDPRYFHPSPGFQSDNSRTPRLVYAGTLSAHHGVDIAIRAVRLLCDRGSTPIEFHIYGTGPEKDQLLSLTSSLNLQHVVFFHPQVRVEEIAKILPSMDIGIVPKRAGVFADLAMSTKLFEFAAVGLPVIVSRTTADSLYFDDTMVLFFDPGNERQLADCIISLCQNPKYRQRLATNAKRVFQHVSWELVQRDFCAIVDGVYLQAKEGRRESHATGCR